MPPSFRNLSLTLQVPSAGRGLHPVRYQVQVDFSPVHFIREVSCAGSQTHTFGFSMAETYDLIVIILKSSFWLRRQGSEAAAVE